MIVDIICTVLNGATHLGAFLRSLAGQTHDDWRLWVRDDGSTDATVDIILAAAAADPRIQLTHRGGPRLGVAGGFGWALERVPPDSAYVMCADADDVWLPHKVALTLERMRAAESAGAGPVLVHTDLIVTDSDLRTIHPSFWSYSGIDVSRTSLRDLIVRNVVTGCTTMMNRALRERIGRAPPEALYHDWWHACVASVFGRIVAVGEGTLLYRQHGANIVGARSGAPIPLHALPAASVTALRGTARLRRQLAGAAAQAGAFLERYRGELAAGDREFLEAYARMPAQPFFRRKLDIMRLQLRAERGIWRNLGTLLRA